MTVQGYARSWQAGPLGLSLAPLIRIDMNGPNA